MFDYYQVTSRENRNFTSDEEMQSVYSDREFVVEEDVVKKNIINSDNAF